jgi:hypothetical protein
MKRFVFGVMALLLVSTGAFAQWSVGGSAGLNYLLDADVGDLPGDVNRIGFPVLLEVGYEIGGRSNPLVVGGKVGFINNLLGYEYTENLGFGSSATAEFSSRSIPFFGFARYDLGMLYGELGLGLNAWSYEGSSKVESQILGNQTIDLADSGVGLLLYGSGGVQFALSESFTLLAGPALTILGLDDGSDLYVGASVGASFGL